MAEQEIFRSLTDSLGLDPLMVETEKKQELAVIEGELVPYEEPEREPTQEEKDAEEDFKFARDNMKSMIEMSGEALEGINRLAQASEAPRAFEVVAKLIETMTKANEGLMKLHDARRQLSPPPPPPPKPEPANITNNTVVFSGTTAELLEQIKNKKMLGNG